MRHNLFSILLIITIVCTGISACGFMPKNVRKASSYAKKTRQYSKKAKKAHKYAKMALKIDLKLLSIIQKVCRTRAIELGMRLSIDQIKKCAIDELKIQLGSKKRKKKKLSSKQHKLVGDFTDMSRQTGGKILQTPDASQVPQEIHTFIGTLKKNTDLVLVVDTTGSMADDIYWIKKESTRIIKKLKKKKKSRLGVVSYGDRLCDGPRWFSAKGLHKNFKIPQKWLHKIPMTGGCDLPESMYDALYKTMNEMKWRKKAHKEIVVITDAPPLTGRKTNYEEADILKYAKKNRMKITTLYISW